MEERKEVKFVADKARETFIKIKKLRKARPKYTKPQRDELEAEIKKLKDEWWEEVKHTMIKEEHDNS